MPLSYQEEKNKIKSAGGGRVEVSSKEEAGVMGEESSLLPWIPPKTK